MVQKEVAWHSGKHVNLGPVGLGSNPRLPEVCKDAIFFLSVFLHDPI